MIDATSLRILENNPLVILIDNGEPEHATLIFDDTKEAWDYWDTLKDDKRPMSLNNFGLTMAERNQ